MAEGIINVSNAVSQEQQARQQLDEEFIPSIIAAYDDADNLPGLGQALRREWEELLKVAVQLPEANKSIAAHVDAAHRTMTGGIGTETYGVAHHALDLIQGPNGSQGLTRKAHRVLTATTRLAEAVPEHYQWTAAHEASARAQQIISALGGLVGHVVASTAKVPKSRFDTLKDQGTHASDELKTHMRAL